MQSPSLCPPMAIKNIIYPPYPWQIPCYGSFLVISLTQPLRETRERGDPRSLLKLWQMGA
jgi:hypothetical protein